MPTWERVPPHTPRRCADDVEADVRVLMAKMSQVQSRGFDSDKIRDVLHRRIDVLLDEYTIRADLELLDGMPLTATILTGIADRIAEVGGQ